MQRPWGHPGCPKHPLEGAGGAPGPLEEHHGPSTHQFLTVVAGEVLLTDLYQAPERLLQAKGQQVSARVPAGDNPTAPTLPRWTKGAGRAHLGHAHTG